MMSADAPTAALADDEVYTPPPLDTSTYHRAAIPAQLCEKKNPTDIPVYYDKVTNEAAYISNVHALVDMCDAKPRTVQTGLGAFLNKKQNQHFKRVSTHIHAYTCIHKHVYA